MRWSGPSRRLSPTASDPFTAVFGSDAAGTDTTVLAPAADAVDVLHALVGFLERRVDRQPADHDAAGHVAQDVLRLDLDGGRRQRPRVPGPRAAQHVLQHALEVRVRLPVGIVHPLLVHGTGLADGGLHVLLVPLLVLDPAD